MKKTIRLSVIWILLSMFSATALNAQTYPDYALETVYPMTLSSHVRCYSPTEAVSVYRNYHHLPTYVDYSTISVVDIYGNIHCVNMKDDYVVYDMEIVNGYTR